MAKVKKSKYNRRRAIDCKLIRKSKSNPGYLKYQVTIAEKDGTVHKQPAYGVDMQDALSRLEKQLEYKNNKVNKRIDINENELPKIIRKVVGHIEFARPLDK